MSEFIITKTIDAVPQVNKNLVEVVLCKDCKHHEDEEIGMVYCPRQVGGWVKDDWFCADGEVANVKNEGSKTSGDVK